MTDRNAERMHILEQIERGQLSAAAGALRLEQILAQEETPHIGQPPNATGNAPKRRWRDWWRVPFIAGVGLVLAAALAQFLALQSRSAFWFACAGAPLLGGVALAALAWRSRSARWLHVRVRRADNGWPGTVALSLPLPFAFAARVLRLLRRYVSGLGATYVDEVVLALEQGLKDGEPLVVEVDETGTGGERIQVFLG